MSESRSTVAESGRVPLTAPRAVSIFGVSVVGFMSANLVPVMIVALKERMGFTVPAAGTLMSASLLVCAVTCLLTSGWTAHSGRYLVARAGLTLTALGFGVAAFVPSVPVVVGGIIVGGLGAGGAVSAGGAALGALLNPDRASGISGFTNRAVVAVVLFVVPVLGAGMASAFGLVAGLALVTLFTTGWLPDRPSSTTALTKRLASDTSTTTSRATTVAGMGLLACFALWALSEDSMWAVAATMGADQAGLDETGMGLVLSLSAAGGLIASAGVGVVGSRLGRTVPLVLALTAGGALKLIASHMTEPVWYMVVVIAWNTIYMVAFIYIVAVAAALDASGKWSAPVLGVYLIGSSLAPAFSATVSAAAGYAALGWVLAGITFVLVLPFILIARHSACADTASSAVTQSEFPQAAIV